MPRPVSAAGAAARVGAPHTARAYLRLQFLAGRVLPVVIDGAVRQTGEHVHRRRRAQQPRGIAATSSGNSSSNRDAFVAELQTAPLPYLATFVTPLPPDLSSGIAAASSWPPPSSVVTLQDVSKELRRRFANKAYANMAVLPADVRAVSTILGALIADRGGRHGSTYDVTTGWLKRAIRADAIVLVEQGEQLSTVLDLLARSGHRSIAVIELLREVRGKLLEGIAEAYDGRGARRQLSAPLLCRLLRAYHTHGHYPGERLLDAAGPYLLRPPESGDGGSARSLTSAQSAELLQLLALFRHHPGRRLLAALLLHAWWAEVSDEETAVVAAARLLHMAAGLDPPVAAAPPVAARAKELLVALTGMLPRQPQQPSNAAAAALCGTLWALAGSGELSRAQLAAGADSLVACGAMAPGALPPAALADLHEAVVLCGVEPLPVLLGEAGAAGVSAAYHRQVLSRGSRGMPAHAPIDMRAALTAAGRPATQQQVTLPCGALVDFVVGGSQEDGAPAVALLLEGPTDAAANAPHRPTGHAAARRALVASSGAYGAVVPVSWATWRGLVTGPQRIAFLESILPPAP
eukprot:jgi/Tetstr1/433140/TSEL_022472.t1